jgi:SHS2 domain-containing protein
MVLTDESPSSQRLGEYDFVDHTSEITVRLRASTWGGLLQEATRAFAALVPESIELAPSSDVREFEIDAPDRAAGLVEWLNELVYAAEAELWLPMEIEVHEDGETLRVRARGATLSAPFVLVKAATLHRARVDHDDDGWTGEVTLDL